MNLQLVHNLLEAANDRPHGFLKIRGAKLVREVEMMTAAGLVESNGTVHGLEAFAVIKRITKAGHTFLRAFKDHPPVSTKRSVGR
jgi:hypothetical protein